MPVAVAGQRLVDGVVHDLPDQVVQAALAGGADVHAGALADRLEPLEHLDRGGVVLAVLDRVALADRSQARPRPRLAGVGRAVGRPSDRDVGRASVLVVGVVLAGISSATSHPAVTSARHDERSAAERGSDLIAQYTRQRPESEVPPTDGGIRRRERPLQRPREGRSGGCAGGRSGPHTGPGPQIAPGPPGGRTPSALSRRCRAARGRRGPSAAPSSSGRAGPSTSITRRRCRRRAPR